MPCFRKRTTIVREAFSCLISSRRTIATTKSNISPQYSIQYEDVVKAAERIGRVGAHVTPVLTSMSLNQMISSRQGRELRVFFKAECLQRTGSFKFRGAANAILSLLEEETKTTDNSSSNIHIVSHSSGNHAQGLACVANSLQPTTKLETTIFMPRGASEAKKQSVLGYGANVVLTANDTNSRINEARLFAHDINTNTNKKAALIHPFEDVHVMAGQGTVAFEMVRQVPDLDAVIIPVGGGALASGCSIVLRHVFGRNITILLAEPVGFDDTRRSLIGNTLVGHSTVSTNNNNNPTGSSSTVADGLKAELGALQFPILRDMVDDVMVASDAEILNATRLLWERLNVIVEPSAAIGLAILLGQEFQQLLSLSTKKDIRNVGVILCGGNCDIGTVAQQFMQLKD